MRNEYSSDKLTPSKLAKASLELQPISHDCADSERNSRYCASYVSLNFTSRKHARSSANLPFYCPDLALINSTSNVHLSNLLLYLLSM